MKLSKQEIKELEKDGKITVGTTKGIVEIEKDGNGHELFIKDALTFVRLKTIDEVDAILTLLESTEFEFPEIESNVEYNIVSGRYSQLQKQLDWVSTEIGYGEFHLLEVITELTVTFLHKTLVDYDKKRIKEFR